MIETLPRTIHDIAMSIKECADERAQVLQDSAALWDELTDAWFKHSGTRLLSAEFCSAVTRFQEFFKTLAAQGQKQQASLNDLKVCFPKAIARACLILRWEVHDETH